MQWTLYKDNIIECVRKKQLIMKRSELRQLIREMLEEEFSRSPANKLDNIFGRANPDQLKDEKFLISKIIDVLKTEKIIDAKTISDIRKMLAWKNINTTTVDQAINHLKTA